MQQKHGWCLIPSYDHICFQIIEIQLYAKVWAPAMKDRKCECFRSDMYVNSLGLFHSVQSIKTHHSLNNSADLLG